MDKKSLSVAILGSRGIPNRYGGFEAFAEELSVRLAARGHKVLVYTVREHPIKDETWKGVTRVLVDNPEGTLGTFGQFIYDLKCTMHSRRDKPDIILHLGYTSDSVWYRLWPKNSLHLVNMDGQEWNRSKYSRLVKAFLRLAEQMATIRSKWLIADNGEMEKYLSGKFKVPVRYIAYGANLPAGFSTEIPGEWGLEPGNYDLAVARMEPENNIEMAILAKIKSGNKVPLVIIGNQNKYKNILQEKYGKMEIIRFLEAVYDEEKLNSLRHFSRIYVHGHSVGGTNPSLLEAMACSCSIVAHGNLFNRFVLGDEAMFFTSQTELASLFNGFRPGDYVNLIDQNLVKIRSEYSWEAITDAYENLFYDAAGPR